MQIASERRWGGLTERLLVATARSYVVSPAALGAVATDPERSSDRLSAQYLVALAARIVREVGSLAKRADEIGKRLPTLALDTEVSFRSAAERARFTDDLAQTVTALVAKYHTDTGAGRRRYRLVIGAHPLPTPEPEETS